MNPQQVLLKMKNKTQISASQGLFNEIYNLALGNNEAGLEKLITDGKCIQVRWYHSHYFHTPASLLAAQGKDEAVKLLFKVESGTIDSILYGYALASNSDKVEEYLKLKGSINAAMCGYIARLDSDERSRIPSQFDPDAKLALRDNVNNLRNFGLDYLVEGCLKRGASLNVALMAYAKANANPVIVDDFVARGAEKCYAMYGYAQIGNMGLINKLKDKQDPPWREIAYRFALGKHSNIINACFLPNEDLQKIYVGSIAKGYAQSDKPLPPDFINNRTHGIQESLGYGYRIAGRPHKAQQHDNPGINFLTTSNIYAKSGNMRYVERQGQLLPGRNLLHAEKFINKIRQMNADANGNRNAIAQLADRLSFESLRKHHIVESELECINAFILGVHQFLQESNSLPTIIISGHSGELNFFEYQIVELIRLLAQHNQFLHPDNVTRTLYFFPEGPVRDGIIKQLNPDGQPTFRGNVTETLQKIEYMKKMSKQHKLSFNQALALADPSVNAYVYHQLWEASEAGIKARPPEKDETAPSEIKSEFTIETTLNKDLVSIVMEYLTPLHSEESKKVYEIIANPDFAEQKAIVGQNVSSLELLYGKESKNESFETAVRAQQHIASAESAKDGSQYIHIRDAHIELRKLELPELRKVEYIKRIIAIVQNHGYWHKEWKANPPIYKRKIGSPITTNAGTILIPPAIEMVLNDIKKYPDWETNPDSMEQLRLTLRKRGQLHPQFSAKSDEYLQRFYLFLSKLDPYNTYDHDFKNKEFLFYQNDIEKFNIKAKDVYRKLNTLIDDYQSRLSAEATEHGMLTGLKIALGKEPSSDEEYFSRAQHFLNKLTRIKHEYQEPQTAEWKKFLKAAYDILSFILVVPAVVRAAVSYKRYDTCRFWKDENVRMRDKAEDLIRPLVFQHPVRFGN